MSAYQNKTAQDLQMESEFHFGRWTKKQVKKANLKVRKRHDEAKAEDNSKYWGKHVFKNAAAVHAENRVRRSQEALDKMHHHHHHHRVPSILTPHIPKHIIPRPRIPGFRLRL